MSTEGVRIGVHGDTSDDYVEQGEQVIEIDAPFLVGGRLIAAAAAWLFNKESFILLKITRRLHCWVTGCMEAIGLDEQKDCCASCPSLRLLAGKPMCA